MKNRLIHVSRCRGMTRSLLRNLLRIDKTLKMQFDLTVKEFCDMFNITRKRASMIIRDLHDDALSNKIAQEKKKFDIITIFDKSYPFLLKNINDKPLVLYLYGKKELLQKYNTFSIIGSRQPSPHAWKKTEYIVKPLVENDFIIVSGMAQGIDTYSHVITLQEEGHTIAVLGSGFHEVYPRFNQNLFEQIANKGLVVSEYAPDVKPKRYHFPERNRIISGLSFGTVVIEAKRKSGTLITVEKALNQGREVYAIPGSILTKDACGCHELIQDGAKLITNAFDLIEDWKEIGLRQYGIK